MHVSHFSLMLPLMFVLMLAIMFSANPINVSNNVSINVDSLTLGINRPFFSTTRALGLCSVLAESRGGC